jgi:hypothetical protein
MKIRVYWIAVYDDSDDAVDMKCLSGPYPTWAAAFDAQEEGVIVSQIVEVDFQ